MRVSVGVAHGYTPRYLVGEESTDRSIRSFLDRISTPCQRVIFRLNLFRRSGAQISVMYYTKRVYRRRYDECKTPEEFRWQRRVRQVYFHRNASLSWCEVEFSEVDLVQKGVRCVRTKANSTAIVWLFCIAMPYPNHSTTSKRTNSDRGSTRKGPTEKIILTVFRRTCFKGCFVCM